MIGKIVSNYLISVIMVAVVIGVVAAPDTFAANFSLGMSDGASAARGVDQATDLFGEVGIFRTITNVLLFLIGAISVIMLIIGGLRYVVSGGDATAVQGAKNTILYAIVGVVVAILSYAAVGFVISSFTGTGSV
ncbi:MAG: hypothetical protein WAS27_02080 [Candidatus Saccharimonadales bacterium]